MPQHIIGLGHYSRTGKNTLGLAIAKELGARGISAKVTSFADKLKTATHVIYGWAGVEPGQYYEDYPLARNIRLPALACDKWPQGPTVVDLWIAVGTPAIREQVYDSTWIEATLSEPFDGVVIVTDMRFPNEVAAIRKRGGLTVKVIRDGFGPRSGSVADAALLGYEGWDMIVDNDPGMVAINKAAAEIATLAWVTKS